jgi:hypothetical protein
MKLLAELIRGAAPLWDEPDPVKDPVAEPKAEPVAEPKAEPEPAAQPDAALPKWAQDRINKLTAQKADLQSKLNSAAKPAPATAATAAPLDPAADWDSRLADAAQRQAQAMVATQTFNERCNAAVEAGRAEYGEAEFNAAVAGLQKLVDATDAASIATYQDMLESALETGKAADLIYELGRDLNEAQRVFDLSPKKRAIELAQRAAKAGSVAEPSSAAKPIRAIEPRGGRHEQISADDTERADKLSTAEWMARRNAQVAAQAGRR